MLASPRVDERTQALLESVDPGDRLEGLRLVALQEDQDAASLAARLLASDPEVEVREHAARALGVTVGALGLDGLLRAARADRDAMVRRTALVVLGETGERAVASALRGLLDEADAHDLASALDALRTCGSAEDLPPIVELARSESPHVAALALHAWAALAPEPRPAPPEVDAVAARVLEKGPFWALASAALVKGDSVGSALAREASRHERESAVYRALDLPAKVANEALRALVGEAERSGQHEVGLAAARELARRGDPSGASMLARVLYDPESRGRLSAAAALAELGAPMGEPLLLKALEGPTSTERGLVARALALSGHESGVRALGALLSSDLPAERRFAANGFAALGRADGAAELVRTLDYPLRTERVEAAAALRLLWPEAPGFDAAAPSAERRGRMESYTAHFKK